MENLGPDHTGDLQAGPHRQLQASSCLALALGELSGKPPRGVEEKVLD